MKNKKLVIFIIALISIVILNNYFGFKDNFSTIENLDFITNLVNENMAFAIVIYTLFTVIGATFLALPGIIFALVAGVMFGPYLGTLLCLVSTTIGASLAFLVARYFLKDSVKPMLAKNQVLNNLLFSGNRKKDIIILMITRMLPIFPFNLQNFAYGVTDISFVHYSMYSFIFMIPGVAMYTVGASGLNSGANGTVYFLIALGIGIILIPLSKYIKTKYL